MYEFPNQPQKIKARIRRYERLLRKEYEQTHFISDGYGKRYLLGPLYIILGDLPGALRSFEWFGRTFPNDIGEPFHSLCWTLALYRSGDIQGAKRKLLQTMLLNLYLVPHLVGLEQDELDIWHGMNIAEKDYVQYIPPELLSLWDGQALQWAKDTFLNPAFSQVRTRHIEIYHELKYEPPGPRRTQLVDQLSRLESLVLD